MRNYWLKILLGALGIFVVGMIGVTIVRSGIAKVNSVVEGDGPITIPLGLIPFALEGEKLGNLDRVTLNRESPTRVSDVELEVNLNDSLLAQGLAGCRLAANFEGDEHKRGVNIKVGRDQQNTFLCLKGDSVPPELVEYGAAIFQPGEVEVQLFIPAEMVKELQSLDFGHDSATAGIGDSIDVQVPNVDSIRAEVDRQVQRAQSAGAFGRRFADSVRAEARKRMAAEEDSQ
jgi:hypothetical protein